MTDTETDDKEHFDGLLVPDERSPGEFARIDGVTAVLADPNTGRLVLMGEPTAFHNCDERGCGSLQHKIAEFNVSGQLFYQNDHRENDETGGTESSQMEDASGNE